MWQIEGRFGPWEERERNFGGQLEYEEPHFDREVWKLLGIES